MVQAVSAQELDRSRQRRGLRHYLTGQGREHPGQAVRWAVTCGPYANHAGSISGRACISQWDAEDRHTGGLAHATLRSRQRQGLRCYLIGQIVKEAAGPSLIPAARLRHPLRVRSSSQARTLNGKPHTWIT